MSIGMVHQNCGMVNQNGNDDRLAVLVGLASAVLALLAAVVLQLLILLFGGPAYANFGVGQLIAYAGTVMVVILRRRHP